jgi:hypothetical protein
MSSSAAFTSSSRSPRMIATTMTMTVCFASHYRVRDARFQEINDM